MKIHLKILAWLYLLIGGFILIGFLAANLLFLRSPLFQTQSSVLDNSFSFFGRLKSLWENYLEFFTFYGFSGIDLLMQILLCGLLLTFAIGLLKNKSWARILGFVIVFLNVIALVSAIYQNYFSFSQILTILLLLYTIFVLTSSETKKLLN